MSQTSKSRECPAAGRTITVSDCVANRHTHYACPPTCPHDPFTSANYDRFLEMENKVDRKSMDYVLEHAADRAALEKSLQQARYHPSAHALHAWFAWQLFFATGPDGLTCGQRWEKSCLSELKSDQRFLLRAKLKTHIALLEIHRVLDGERVEAVDLLSPGAPPMTFQDRSLAGVAVRFANALTWVYPLPHFWRLSGTAVLIPDLGSLTAEKIVAEIARHLGGPAAGEPLRRWLAEHLVRFDDALQATARLRRMRMFAGLDAQYGKGLYELRAPFVACRGLLDELPQVDPDELSDAERQEGFAEARVWFADVVEMKQSVPPGGRPVLGRVLLGQTFWRVEAFGGERFRQLRRQFEACLGERVRFTGERVDDLGAAMAAKEKTPNEALVPPRLLEEPQKLVFASSRIPAPPAHLSREETELEFVRAADRAFLEDHIPALDHKTPREAARDSGLRPKLIRLLKQRVRMCDERNLKSGGTDDINWLLRELGADEIIFDPPPPRPPLPDHSPEDEWDDDDAPPDVVRPNPELPPAPPLPAAPFSVKEAARRLDTAMERFDTAETAQDALDESGATILDDASALTAELLSDEEYSFSVVFLLQAWFALVPPGYRPPVVRYEDLEAALQRNLRELENSLRSGSVERLVDYGKSGAQPELMLLLTNEILHSGMKAPKKIRPSAESLGTMLALVKAVVDELDAALRQRGRHYT